MASIPADVIYKVTLHAGNGAVTCRWQKYYAVCGREKGSRCRQREEEAGAAEAYSKAWYTDCDFAGTPVTYRIPIKGDKVFYTKWEWDGQEQFKLHLSTCYFDLFRRGNTGTVNGGNADRRSFGADRACTMFRLPMSARSMLTDFHRR